MFELDDFLSNQTKSVTSMSTYWNPKPAPTHKPVPISEMKISHSTIKKKKRKVTPCDDSWIDSFDPTIKEKIDFANKLRKIDPCPGILDYLQLTLMILKTLLHSLNTTFHICMYHPKLKTMSRQILKSFQKTICLILLKNF